MGISNFSPSTRQPLSVSAAMRAKEAPPAGNPSVENHGPTATRVSVAYSRTPEEPRTQSTPVGTPTDEYSLLYIRCVNECTEWDGAALARTLTQI